MAEADSQLDTCWIVSPRTGDDGIPDIHFLLQKYDCPQEQLDLKERVESSLTVIKKIYEDRPFVRDEYIARLVSLSQAGLVGQTANPKIGHSALNALSDEIVSREAGTIKNSYMRTLGIWCLGFGLSALLVRALVDFFPEIFWFRLTPHANVLIVWAGCMASAWVSFATRKTTLQLGDLVHMEEDKVDPPLRLIFVGLLSVAVCVFLLSGLFSVSVGSFSTTSLQSSGLVALTVGIAAGLAEKALPGFVTQKAAGFFK